MRTHRGGAIASPFCSLSWACRVGKPCARHFIQAVAAGTRKHLSYHGPAGRRDNNRSGCMRAVLVPVVLLALAPVATAQQPSSAFDRGRSLQAWQDPGYAALTARCKVPPPPRATGGGTAPAATAAAPPAPALPAPDAIAGVIAPGQHWKVVWSWEGNNADGPIAGDDGSLLFANNDASNVMRLDPATRARQRAVRQHEHRWRGVPKQGWRAVPRSARIGRRHRAARAAATHVREYLPGRTSRVRRGHRERSRRGRPRRRLSLGIREWCVPRQSGRQTDEVWRRPCGQRHHPEPGRTHALRHERWRGGGL